MISYYHLSSKDTPVLDIYLHITTCLWMTHRPPTMSYYHLPSKDTPASVSVMGWWCTILTPAFHWHTGLRHWHVWCTAHWHTGPRQCPSNNMLCIHYHMSWKDTPAFDVHTQRQRRYFIHDIHDHTQCKDTPASDNLICLHITTFHPETHRPPTT